LDERRDEKKGFSIIEFSTTPSRVNYTHVNVRARSYEEEKKRFAGNRMSSVFSLARTVCFPCISTRRSVPRTAHVRPRTAVPQPSARQPAVNRKPPTGIVPTEIGPGRRRPGRNRNGSIGLPRKFGREYFNGRVCVRARDFVRFRVFPFTRPPRFSRNKKKTTVGRLYTFGVVHVTRATVSCAGTHAPAHTHT